MFLKTLIKRNKPLIDFSRKAFFSNLITPNTYVLDLDSIEENAKLLKSEADKYGITLYQMTKQFGRNPLVAQTIAKAGIEKAVCVDFEEALILANNDIKIGNVGHLVQTPNGLIKKILSLKPEVMTIFCYEKAKIINDIAMQMNIIQNIIIKVYSDNDIIYPGQNGGIKIDDLKSELSKINKLSNVKIIGFTAFPTFLFDGHTTKETNNLQTVKNAILIAKKMDLKITHVNLPSANSTQTLKKIAKHGGTHGEPGHAFTGTVPINTITELPEKPAILYISEISHTQGNTSYFYGGGYYRRGFFSNILVSSKEEKDFKHFSINALDPNSIDYYFNFNNNGKKVQIGDVVIGSFRAQIFATRTKVAIVKGLKTNNPKIIGTFSSQGEPITWI